MRRRSGTEPRRRAGRAAEAGKGAVALGRPLPRSFYRRSALVLARDVLGRPLVCDSPRGRVAGIIVETEAYRGRHDPASHAYRGPTPRARVMFGPPGHAYVYYIYGAHHCLNLVAEPEGQAAAVLVRALAPVMGVELMRRRRGVRAWEALARGPGNLARALGLTRAHDGADLTVGPVWLGDRRPQRFGCPTARGPRVGIRRAAGWPWRFFLAGHPCVSGPRGAGRPAGRASSRLTPP